MYRPSLMPLTAGVGDMPNAMLTSKYEATMTPDTTYLYEEDAREALTDWGPDKNKFEDEEPRGRINASSGIIQNRYYGHRGNAEDNYRPEHFDGFHGVEDRDPRGIAVEPDMKQLRRQVDSRMRFQRWNPDMSEQITGGGMSEARQIKDQQTAFGEIKKRLKIFATMLDGRREGMRRFFDKKSDVKKTVMVQSYGDLIKDYALTPQRRANKISEQILRDSRGFRENTADAEFAVAKYDTLCRRNKGRESGIIPRSTEGDAKYGTSDGPKHYTAVALLMSSIVQRRAQAASNGYGDGAKSEANDAVTRSSAPLVRDLTAILAATTGDSRAGESSKTLDIKTKGPEMAEHLARTTTADTITPAHMNLAAELMFKSLAGGDTRKTAGMTAGDAKSTAITESGAAQGKAARKRIMTGAKLARDYDADHTESMRTFNYRTLVSKRDHRARTFAGEMDYNDAARTHDRKALDKMHRGHTKNDTMDEGVYSENMQKERLGGRIGSKNTRRLTSRETREADFADF